MSQLEQNKALARRWFEEVWNQGNSSAIDEFYHAEGRCYGFPTAESSISPAEFKDVHAEFKKAFSNIQVTVEDLIAEDDKVGIRWQATMDHTGHGLGFAPTKNKAILSGAAVIQCRDGRILNGWNYIDMQHLYNQMQ